MPTTTDREVMRTHRHHPITRSLRIEYERCLAPRRQRATMLRWANHPSLAGRSIPDIVATCARQSIEQNDTLETLIRLHQLHDRDATIVVMTIIHPVVTAAARRLHSDPHHRHDAAWAAACHALATINPSEARRRADQHGHPMLAHFAHRLRNSDWSLNPADRNEQRRQMRPSAVDTRLVSLDDERTGEMFDHHQVDVTDQAQAILDLQSIAGAIATGVVTQEEWRFLVDHRFHRTQPATGRERAQAHRTTKRLTTLLDPAA